MEKMSSNLEEIIENEWYLVRYSGETPEIAFNSAIYYLTRSKQGPGVSLGDDQFDQLRKAAVDRYAEIVVRDLQHDNHNTSVYRGLSRSIVNYNRFCAFCRRHQMDWPDVRYKAAQALLAFIEREIEEIKDSGRKSIIDCTYSEVKKYATELGVGLSGILDGIKEFCCQ